VLNRPHKRQEGSSNLSGGRSGRPSLTQTD
jgi:hypothetical protein